MSFGEVSIQPITKSSGREKTRDSAPSHACLLCDVEGIPQFPSTPTMGGHRSPQKVTQGSGGSFASQDPGQGHNVPEVPARLQGF